MRYHHSIHRRPSLPTTLLMLLSITITTICQQHMTPTDATAISASKTSRRYNYNADDDNHHPSSSSVARMEVEYVASSVSMTTTTPPLPATTATTTSAQSPTSSNTSNNPVFQLATYVKDTVLNFKNGLSQMASNHKRCNAIRARQAEYYGKEKKRRRPRGVAGMQVGGISYEEYDFLKKGLVDRNKLLAVTVVMLCLPNYFVYYLWSFPDMMPSPFLTAKDPRDIGRERCHAVVAALLDVEKGARVPPWTSKLNPFGKKGTERAMERLGLLADKACDVLSLDRASGPSHGARLIMNAMQSTFYTNHEPNKQQLALSSKYFPKQIFKGLNKVVSADPLNKGSSPFGIGLVKHIESVSLADEFLIRQNVNVEEIHSELLKEACSARLIGGPNWTDEERRVGLVTWLNSFEGLESRVKNDAAAATTTVHGDENNDTDEDMLYLNPNLARAVYMCYNALDATRDGRSESRLGRLLYQGQLVKKEGLSTSGAGGTG